MTDAPEPSGPPQGALLTEEQIKRLKVAIAIMSVLMLAGIVTLIARVMYLASGSRDPASAANPATASALGPVLAEARLALPPGAELRTSSLHGNRLLAHYKGPKGDGLVILDLATGKTVSHVRIETGP